MKNAIIFGAAGQDGFYLTKLLEEQNFNVIGVSRSEGFVHCDITNYEAVSKLVKETQPLFIFHLAANSTTHHSALFENHQTISTGTLNILEAVKNESLTTKVFISGSGLQFLNNDLPIKETDSFEARDAYSISRIQSVYAARYFRSIGVKAYVGYFFNHDSPRRSERHMAMKIAAFAKRIGEGNNEKLEIGDVSAIKEYTYAGDVVNGIWTLVNQDAIFEANIGSGKGYSIEEWLETCFSLIGKDWKQYIVQKEGFVSHYKQLVSDSTLMFSLGWKPKVSLKELAESMMK